MLISCGSCEKPSHPGNYDASEISRSIAWSSTMIFGCQIFFSSSHCYSHCRLLNHFFLADEKKEGLSSSPTGWSHCSAGVRPWRTDRDDLCCLFGHVVTQANYKHCGYKREHTFSPSIHIYMAIYIWPLAFTLLLTSFETMKYRCRHALLNNNRFHLVWRWGLKHPFSYLPTSLGPSKAHTHVHLCRFGQSIHVCISIVLT